MDPSGKVAIITGGATGIGRSAALALAACGCNIVVNYTRSEKEALETVADATKRGAEATAVRADVSNDDDCRRLVNETLSRWKRLDALVNSAGTTVFVPPEDLEALTSEMWDSVFAVNVRGAFFMMRAAAPALRASGEGAIVNVSSTAGINGGGSSIPYAASKAALNNLTLSFARVLAPQVRVNTVAPGFVDTRWLQRGYGAKLDVIRAFVKKRTLLGDTGRPEHIAQAVVSLIIGMDWVTGETIVVDGGFMARG